MKKMYIVSYSVGQYDDWHEENLFVTDKKSKATNYVAKFNKILERWKDYYTTLCADVRLGDNYFKRWNCLREINKCYFEEVEVR